MTFLVIYSPLCYTDLVFSDDVFEKEGKERIGLGTAGLITFHFAHHYGAQLQAYATMRAVEQLGTSCEVIDYRLPHTTGTNQIFKKGFSPRVFVQNLHTAIHKDAFMTRFQRFEDFVSQELHLSEAQYESVEQLSQCPPVYDTYISGSDQIWSPSVFADGRLDPAFFLTFAQKGRKISYASSFGGTPIQEEMRGELAEYLSSFDAVSARERQAQSLLEEILQRPVPLVVDPTLLLDGKDWAELAVAPSRTGPYILCYFISDYSDLLPYLEQVKGMTGYPVVQLAGTRRPVKNVDEVIFDAGPKEFLGLFQNAAYVLTNSFHGTAFAIQFEKPFYTAVSPKERLHPEQSRTFHLLEIGGITDRLTGLPVVAKPDCPIDYGAVRKRLDAQRAASIVYLGNALLDRDSGAEANLIPPVPKTSEAREIKLAGVLNCTGCFACAAACPMGCITMKPDQEGFLRPDIGESCMRCGKCMEACPVLMKQTSDHMVKGVYAAWTTDADVRAESTSGGVFTALAKEVLKEGGVVFGAAFDQAFCVRHVAVEEENGLSRLRGAKYVQSDLGNVFLQVKEKLEEGRQVLFSGTPCQTAGLLQFLKTPYDNLLVCDLVCHGVPSPAVWEEFRKKLQEERHRKLMAVSFRSKEDGWNNAKFSAEFAGKVYYIEPLMETPYGRGFGMALFLRPSCYRCPFASLDRKADLTLGDFWGVSKEALPPEAQLEAGISLVLTHTEKGQAAFEAIEETTPRVERPLEEAIAGNPRLVSSVELPGGRGAFFHDFATLPYGETEKKWLSLPSWPYRMAAKILGPGVKQKIRKLLKK